MNYEGQVYRLIVSLNPRYAVRNCEWTGMAGFEDADAEVLAFIIGSILKFKPRMLELIAQQMSPLAVGYLLWSAAEMKHACGFSLNLRTVMRPSASERSELARYADDGNALCDDNY